MFNMQNDDESSIRSGTKSRILMEFPRKLAAVWQCRVYQKQRESILFEYRSSTSPPFPLRRHMHITRILCLRLLLFFFLFLSLFFSIFSSRALFLSLPRRARYRSLAARKIVSRDCQKYALRTHLSVRLHLSVRCRSQDDGGISPSDRTDD